MNDNLDLKILTIRDLLFRHRVESINWQKAHEVAYALDEDGEYVLKWDSPEHVAAQDALMKVIDLVTAIEDEIANRIGDND